MVAANARWFGASKFLLMVACVAVIAAQRTLVANGRHYFEAPVSPRTFAFVVDECEYNLARVACQIFAAVWGIVPGIN